MADSRKREPQQASRLCRRGLPSGNCERRDDSTTGRKPERPSTDARRCYDRAVDRSPQRVVLPTFAQLADPATHRRAAAGALADVDPDAAHALNLFRVHWYNDADARGAADVPAHVVLPAALTGVDAPIIVALGDRFPMIRAHKVLAAYACLVPRLVTGQFDPGAPARGVAVDRQLLPRRRGDLAHPRLPRRRRPARRA